ncbi:unnamed protein product, partial [Brassica oleracea]
LEDPTDLPDAILAVVGKSTVKAKLFSLSQPMLRVLSLIKI